MARPKINKDERYKRVRKGEVQKGDAITFDTPRAGVGYYRITDNEGNGYYVGTKKAEVAREPKPISFGGGRAFLIERGGGVPVGTARVSGQSGKVVKKSKATEPERKPEQHKKIKASAGKAPNYEYSIVDDGEEVTVLVIDSGGTPHAARPDHPNYERILSGVETGADIIDLFHPDAFIAKKFERLTERITVRNGKVYLDGDEIDNVLTKQIIKFMDEGVEDWKPLAQFFEKLAANPLEHSRNELYGFIRNAGLTLTDEGDIVAYKGVHKRDGSYVSDRSGKAIVDGQPHEGQIPNPIGAVIEMPRSEVRHDPRQACHVGLHVAKFGFAKTFASTNTTLEVHINPRDVVSVPNGGDKMRVCRYKIAGVVERPHEGILRK